MTLPVIAVVVAREYDVVAARQRARQLAALLGFEPHDQTRIATATSEVARNALQYGGGGRVEFAVEGDAPPQVLLVRISDKGPGIPELAAILSGRYRSRTGLGLGLVGSRRLMDGFEIDGGPGRGTTVSLRKVIPRAARLVTPATVGRLADALARQASDDPLSEVQQQNQELLLALEELRRRQEQLAMLNRELEDTNRGVLALYAELDERGDHLRRADELKSRFLSNMSHEFRTPLNSILALSRLLLDRVDGPLGTEQERQILFIRKAAEDLFQLVSDLLDLARVEAGRIVVRPAEFTVSALFGALRGMLRPLLVNPDLELVFEDPGALPLLCTDEAKVSQILRNFISNALKFTERGVIRVGARLTADGRAVIFSVSDTGIGIAREDQERIFLEFSQLESPVQRRVKGTGLGLPLTRRLAELLGGSVTVESAPGLGSTFSATIPVVYLPRTDRAEQPGLPVATTWEADPMRIPVLVVDADASRALEYQGVVRGTALQVLQARSVGDAQRIVHTARPQAIVVGTDLPRDEAWSFLADLRRQEATRTMPVIALTPTIADGEKALTLGATRFALRPLDESALRQILLESVAELPARRVLVVDDDDVARYLMKNALRHHQCVVIEATTGRDGLQKAREQRPDLIFLDLLLPEMLGIDVLRALGEDPNTRDIPVVVATVKPLNAEERRELDQRAVAILAKESFGRGDGAAEIRRVLVEARLTS